MAQQDSSPTMNPGEFAAQAARRQAELNKTPEQRIEELAQAVDELLARDVDGAEEAAVLERAYQVVNDALGRGE